MRPQVSRYYGRSRTDGKRCFKTTEQLGSYLMEKFAWSDYERAMLVSLSTRRHIKAAVWLREGTSDRVSLDVKDVVATAIKGGTDAVVLCHNHPNGVALPSMEDMEATGSIARALGLVNVHLLDHFIQSRNFLAQNHRNSIDKRLINHISARRFTNAGMPGVIGEYHNIAGEICVMCPTNIKQHAVMPGHRNDFHISNNRTGLCRHLIAPQQVSTRYA